MMRNLCAFLLLAAGVAEIPAAAQNPSAEDLARKVDAHYNHLHSLRTRYTERYRGLGLDRTETGTLLLKKPGRMRWEYDHPRGKVFVVDGKSAVSWTPGDSQADRIPVKKLDDLHSPLRFLLGHTQLSRELDGLSITLIKPGVYSLSGAPHGMAERLKRMALTVNAQGVILGMLIEETDGASTEFSFSQLQEDVPAGEAAFTFVAPSSVTIVDGASPI